MSPTPNPKASSPTDAAFSAELAGIDENGLGPRLGPLLVTAVLASATEAGAPLAFRRARGKLAQYLDDSKKLVAFGDSGLGEAWARALLARQGLTASTPTEALRLFSIDADEQLRARCPDAHAGQCWADEHEAFEADPALVRELEGHLAKLDAKGLRIRLGRLAIVCTDRLNEAARRGLSRFDMDLHAMERLVLDLRAKSAGELQVTCGKVGGIDRYSPHFGPFAEKLYSPLVESRDRSEYAVAGVGRVAFVKDADESSMLVGLASLVGKWARDLLMQRIVRHHRVFDEALPMASGYHDPVTARFVKATQLARKKRGLPDDCFERIVAVPVSKPPPAQENGTASKAETMPLFEG